jgi:hypothetical protein
MSVRPITFNPDGSIEAVFDELGHTGTIPAAEIIWTKDIINTADNHNFIILTCPDKCGAASTWPVGGSDPLIAQQMFVEKTQRDGCACGNVSAGTAALPESHVRLNCNRMGGPGHWQYSSKSNAELFKSGERENAPDSFQVVYHDITRRIDGFEPSGSVGLDHRIGTIYDINEYDNLIKFNPAYLSLDGNHIVGEAP